MENQCYYANFPTKLYHQDFKSKRDRNLHLLAMSIIIGWVHTQTGKFYLSVRKLAEELDCSLFKAKEIIDNFINWGYLKKISQSKNQYQKSVYELSTYNWDLKTAKQTANKTASNKEYQGSDEILKTAKQTSICNQTNNELTNNDITNNEKYSKSVSDSKRTPKEPTPEEKPKEKPPLRSQRETQPREDSPGKKQSYRILPEEVIDLWNAIVAPKTKRPISMSQLTSKELRYLRAACKSYSKVDWINYFERLKASEILFSFESGWKPNIGWALDYDNWGKVVRGDYIPDKPEKVGKTKAELIREQNLQAAMAYAERANQGISFWDSLVCDE